MTPELIALIGKRMTRPDAAPELMNLHKAIAAKSPMVGSRYARALECAGALENPDTTPDERELLLSALSGENAREARTEGIRLRLSPSEARAVRDAAAEAGDTVGAYIRRHLPCLGAGE